MKLLIFGLGGLFGSLAVIYWRKAFSWLCAEESFSEKIVSHGWATMYKNAEAELASLRARVKKLEALLRDIQNYQRHQDEIYK